MPSAEPETKWSAYRNFPSAEMFGNSASALSSPDGKFLDFIATANFLPLRWNLRMLNGTFAYSVFPASNSDAP